jgi:hypothetical protein
MIWNRRRSVGITAAVALIALTTAVGGVARGSGALEPNDSSAAASGPLLAGQSYEGVLETPGDIDFFYFYVAAADRRQSTLTVRNLGGDGTTAVIDAAILDSAATPLEGVSYLEAGKEAAIAVSVTAGRYLVEVRVNPAFNDSAALHYSLSGEGGGAFIPYATIAARCEAARKGTAKTRSGLERVKSRLQRTTTRLHLSRHGSAATRRAARRAQRSARTLVRAERQALKADKQIEARWCQVPQ